MENDVGEMVICDKIDGITVFLNLVRPPIYSAPKFEWLWENTILTATKIQRKSAITKY